MKLKRDFLFLFVILGVVGLLYYLSTRKTKIPAMPADAAHLGALQSKAREDCLKCHTPETLSALELQHKHPGKWSDKRVACTLCHSKTVPAKVALLLPSQRETTLQARNFH